MELWMYLFLIGMFLAATVGTVWITLWTIQRGERRRAEGTEQRGAAQPGPTSPTQPTQPE